MIFTCATCRKIQWFKKYNVVEFVTNHDYEYIKHHLKICDSCADLLEEIKADEEAILGARDI